MENWTANYINDPENDYNIIIEILCNEEDIAIIKNGNNGLEIKWYKSDKDINISLEWLSEVINRAKVSLCKEK